MNSLHVHYTGYLISVLSLSRVDRVFETFVCRTLRINHSNQSPTPQYTSRFATRWFVTEQGEFEARISIFLGVFDCRSKLIPPSLK